MRKLVLLTILLLSPLMLYATNPPDFEKLLYEEGKVYTVKVKFVSYQSRQSGEILTIRNVIYIDYWGDDVIVKTKDKRTYHLTGMYIKYIEIKENP